MRVRRLKKEAAHLEITAFINLIVVLVPFLLSTAVFTKLSVLDLALPAQSSGAVEQLKSENLQLEVVVRPDALDVGDRIGGLIKRIPDVNGMHDTRTLSALMREIKLRFPEQRAATLLAQPDTSYDTLVQLMDAMRSTVSMNRAPGADALTPMRVDLFPDISIGDAPGKKP